MMKARSLVERLRIAACCVILFAGCKEKSPTPQEKSLPSKAAEPAAPPVAEEKVSGPVKQAVVVLRVVYGALKPRDLAGVIVKTEPGTAAPEAQGTCVVALMQGYSEAELRNAEYRYRVFVSQSPDIGDDSSSNHPATLLSFDPKTEIGVFALARNATTSAQLE